MKPITSNGRNQTLGPHPEEAALLSLSKDARPSRRMAAGTISPVAVLRDARILRQGLRSALLRTRLMDEIDMIRCKRFAEDHSLPPIQRALRLGSDAQASRLRRCRAAPDAGCLPIWRSRRQQRNCPPHW